MRAIVNLLKDVTFYVRILLYPRVLSDVKIDIPAAVNQNKFYYSRQTCYVLWSYGPFPQAFHTYH